jgi:hypothetical protein
MAATVRLDLMQRALQFVDTLNPSYSVGTASGLRLQPPLM